MNIILVGNMEIFRWINWQWRQFETWQKAWITGAFFFGAGIGTEGLLRSVLFGIPLAIFFGYTFKWWFYDPALASWREYKRQRDTLFDEIKGK